MNTIIIVEIVKAAIFDFNHIPKTMECLNSSIVKVKNKYSVKSSWDFIVRKVEF